MLKRVMMGLIVLGAMAFGWTEAYAGCAVIPQPNGKRMCASWIKGSAKCLASIVQAQRPGDPNPSLPTFNSVLGRCEVGGTLRREGGSACGPSGPRGELGACNIQGVLSCANQAAPVGDLRLLGKGHHHDDDDDDDKGGLFQTPRFIQRANVRVGDESFDATKEASCDGTDCRVTHELDLDSETGEAACNSAGLSGFDTFTPSTGFMRAEFCDGIRCYALVERCTTLAAGLCGTPYLCAFVARFDFPDPEFCEECTN
jgi:hypothetical protein